MMINLFKKHKISFLDSISWEPLITEIKKISVIPRYGELIYLGEHKKYYKIINIIYSLDKKENIFIIIEEFNDKNVKL